jgi:hypothetical protein
VNGVYRYLEVTGTVVKMDHQLKQVKLVIDDPFADEEEEE